MKICGKCENLVPDSGFHRMAGTADGLHTICKTCRRKKTREYLTEMRHTVILRLGGCCANSECGWINGDGSRGCRDFRCLQIDHIRGGGRREMHNGRPPIFVNYKRIGRSGTAWYYRMLFNLSLFALKKKYQCLCANCNWIKRQEAALKKKVLTTEADYITLPSDSSTPGHRVN